MTKPNKSQQNTKETKLTDRQIKAIPHIVSSPTYTEGCKKAKINKTTLYKWLKEQAFKAELDRQRDEIAAEAFGVLSQGLTRAVETLVILLDNKDDRLKRLAAKDIIDFAIRHRVVLVSVKTFVPSKILFINSPFKTFMANPSKSPACRNKSNFYWTTTNWCSKPKFKSFNCYMQVSMCLPSEVSHANGYIKRSLKYYFL